MHYKTIVKMHYFTQVFQRPYLFNTKANLKTLGTVLFLRARGNQKSFYCLHIPMFLFEISACLCMVEDCKFLEKKTTSY